MKHILEKLLPQRYWKKSVPITDEQFWNAMNQTVNPQTLAVLHLAQDRFMEQVQQAFSPIEADDKRLRALDRAMAIAGYLDEVETVLAGAKAEVIRRDSMKQAA